MTRPGGAASCCHLPRRSSGVHRHRHRRHRGRAARRHGQGDGQHGTRHRDRQLCTDRADRLAAAMGEGPRISTFAARRSARHRSMHTTRSCSSRHDDAHGHDHHGHRTITTITRTKRPPGATRMRRSRKSYRAHWLRRGLPAIVAVGLRPCSGAIIVLVFALAQGLFWIGVASTFVMGLGTAITVAAIATLAVGARACRPAGKGKARRRNAPDARHWKPRRS